MYPWAISSAGIFKRRINEVGEKVDGAYASFNIVGENQMQYCPNCMIQIRGRKARCPLCQRELLNPDFCVLPRTEKRQEDASAADGSCEEAPGYVTVSAAAASEKAAPETVPASDAGGAGKETPETVPAAAAAGAEKENQEAVAEAATAGGGQENAKPVQVLQSMPFEDDDPFVRLPSPKVSFMLKVRMVTFVCISLEILLGAAQIITGGSGWFLAAMLFVLLAWVDFRIAVYYRSNMIRMLTIQGYIIMAACLIIARISKTGSWAVTWVVPFMFFLLVVVTFAAAKAQGMELHEYILYPAFDVLMSLLQIIPIALGTNPIVAPAVICIAFMLILVNSLIIFRGRMLREAAEKYLHL